VKKRALPGKGNSRAAVILFFIVVALPFIWLAGALSVDYARVKMAQNEAQQIVNAAANAAAPFAAQETSALDVNNSTSTLAERAEKAAQGLVSESCENGSSISASGSAECTILAEGVAVSVGTDNSVTVTVKYPINGLIFLGILDRALQLGENVSAGYTAEVSATSRACTASEAAENSSVCFRPAR
jgi:uncharacterized membrane protein